jgi:hypothetical protein
LYFQSLLCNRTHWRQVAKAPCQKKFKNLIFMSAMGSCIKVVKQKKLVCYRTKNVVSCNRLKPKRPLFCHHMQKKGHFSVMGNAQNIISTLEKWYVQTQDISFFLGYYIISYLISLSKKWYWYNIISFSQMLNGNLIYYFDNNTKKKVHYCKVF